MCFEGVGILYNLLYECDNNAEAVVISLNQKLNVERDREQFRKYFHAF